jgi:hypothetical protein
MAIYRTLGRLSLSLRLAGWRQICDRERPPNDSMQGGALAPLAAPITPLCKATDRGAAGVQAHQLLNIASGTDLSSPCVILLQRNWCESTRITLRPISIRFHRSVDLVLYI